jgi:hypothetical protein
MLGLDNDRPANGFSAVMDDKGNGSTFGGGTVEDGNDFAALSDFDRFKSIDFGDCYISQFKFHSFSPLLETLLYYRMLPLGNTP